jgi:hypothetical protein
MGSKKPAVKDWDWDPRDAADQIEWACLMAMPSGSGVIQISEQRALLIAKMLREVPRRKGLTARQRGVRNALAFKARRYKEMLMAKGMSATEAELEAAEYFAGKAHVGPSTFQKAMQKKPR